MSRVAIQRTAGKRETGFTLIETTVAMLILAFGMLGLAYMQTSALQFSQESQHRTVINNMVADMIDRMRAAGISAAEGGATAYTDPITQSEYLGVLAATPCEVTDSTALTVSPRIDTVCFYDKLRNALPGATMRIQVTDLDGGGPETYQLTVFWNDRQIANQSLDSDSDLGELDPGDCAGLRKTWSGTLASLYPVSTSNPLTCLTARTWEFEVISRT